MIPLPDEPVLIERVKASLDAVAEVDRGARIADAGWFPAIAAELAARLHPLGLYSYAKGAPAPCDGGEWLFDFCSLIYDKSVTASERYMLQAAIVGEVEWSLRPSHVEEDFEKLMIADALVCFLVFQESAASDAASRLNEFSLVAAHRQKYAQFRGMTRPPAFLLSCWVEAERRFRHRQLRV